MADLFRYTCRVIAEACHLHCHAILGGDALLKRLEIDGRSDDNEETIRVHLQVYAEQTEPLLEVYRGRGLLVEVDGLGEIEEVSERVFAALEAHREGKASELIEP